MLTLFQIMTTEGWGDIARRVGREQVLGLFIILIFMTITTFAMVNVVVAVIVNSTLENSAALKDDLTKKTKMERLLAVKQFYEVGSFAGGGQSDRRTSCCRRAGDRGEFESR